MRLAPLAPYAAALILGQAVLDAAPVIVAQREGGMGLGSALIAPTVMGLAGVVLGALMAGAIVDRRSAELAMLVGAVTLYAGLVAIGTAPMGGLGWLMAAFGVAGTGFGFVLTAGFAAAAGSSVASRPMGIVLLLASILVARALALTLVGVGPLALLVAGGLVAVLAVVVARARPTVAPWTDRRTPVGRIVVGTVLVALGSLIAVAGADPSRLSATVLLELAGVDRLEVLDAARAAMAVVGIGLGLGGGMLALAARGVPRSVPVAAGALGCASFAASGTGSALTRLSILGGGTGTMAAAGVGTLVGGLVGLGAALWLLGGRGPRLPGVAGGVGIAIATAIVAITVVAAAPPGIALALGGITLAAAGLGMAAAALRLALADVPSHRRGVAAGAGVAAMAIGSVLGSFVGSGLGVPTGDVAGSAGGIGAVALVVAAAGAMALTAVGAPAARPAGD